MSPSASPGIGHVRSRVWRLGAVDRVAGRRQPRQLSRGWLVAEGRLVTVGGSVPASTLSAGRPAPRSVGTAWHDGFGLSPGSARE